MGSQQRKAGTELDSSTGRHARLQRVQAHVSVESVAGKIGHVLKTP